MDYVENITSLVGNTPLIKLKEVSELTGCNILGKAEFLNPGQSVKDRAALSIIRDAEKNNLLEPQGLIVEGTAGNTGIGLTVIGQALGYKTLIVMPETQSEEKEDISLDDDICSRSTSGEQVTSALLSGMLIELGVKAKSWMNWQIPILKEGDHVNSRIVNINIQEINCKRNYWIKKII